MTVFPQVKLSSGSILLNAVTNFSIYLFYLESFGLKLIFREEYLSPLVSNFWEFYGILSFTVNKKVAEISNSLKHWRILP